MQKRGDTLLLYNALILAAGAVIIGIFFNAAVQWASDAPVKRLFLAREFGTQLSAVHSISGNAYLVSSEGIDDRTYSFLDNNVEVLETDTSLLPAIHNYVRSSNEQLNARVENPDRLVIIRNGGQILIEEELPNLIKLDCPDIATKDENWRDKKILIDPSRGGDVDPGLDFDGLTEAEVTTTISDSLAALNENFILTRDSNYFSPIEDRLEKAKDTDAIISFSVGEYSNDLNTAKAYVNFYSSKKTENIKLACLILNSLTELDVDVISIVPIDPEMLSDDDSKNILQFEDKVAVSIEIGNIQTEKGREMLKTLREIPNQIFEGIANYYEK